MSDLYDHLYGSQPEAPEESMDQQLVLEQKVQELAMREAAVKEAERMVQDRARVASESETNEAPATPRGDIINEALRLVTSGRNEVYGHPVQNHMNIARMWNAYVVSRMHGAGWTGELDATDVALMMGMVKLSRAAYRGKGVDGELHDTFVDLVGYSAIAGECYEKTGDKK